MEVKGFIPNSLLDWEGYIVSTVFLPYCNFRCPFCQNSTLIFSPQKFPTIPWEEMENYWKKNSKWIDGVCITGGEPCIYKELPEFIGKIKSLGLKVKLDTNGSFPEMLNILIKGNLVDYIAMDIKAPLEYSVYQKAGGLKNKEEFDKVKESIEILKKGEVEYEFRTTVVPTLHNEEDILKIAQSLKGAKRYFLQNFVPHDTLDPQFEKIKPYDRKILEDWCNKIKRFFKECGVRGK